MLDKAALGLLSAMITPAVLVPERRAELEKQLQSHAQRGRLIQRSLTSQDAALRKE